MCACDTDWVLSGMQQSWTDDDLVLWQHIDTRCSTSHTDVREMRMFKINWDIGLYFVTQSKIICSASTLHKRYQFNRSCSGGGEGGDLKRSTTIELSSSVGIYSRHLKYYNGELWGRTCRIPAYFDARPLKKKVKLFQSR